MTTRAKPGPAFAVVRLDWFHDAARGFCEGSGPNIGARPVLVTIKEIVLSESEARAEVDGGSFGAEERARTGG